MDDDMKNAKRTMRPVTCQVCGNTVMKTNYATAKYCGVVCASKAHPGKKPRHGQSGTREHAAWLDMRNRCRNPDAHNYARYGGRGITVCERWDTFEHFLADMGPKPGKGYSIERKNNDGHYEPENCKWATQLEQNRNRRGVSTTEDDQKIRDGIASGLNFKQIAALLGKSHGSVTARAYYLGLRSGQPCNNFRRSSQISLQRL